MGFQPQDTGTRLLKHSGYARLEAGTAIVIADVAAVGPDYLPGHAHADSLSFELSLQSQRVLVNSGTSVYGTGLDRQRQRGTAAHNTIQIDGTNSSDVWSGFRVGRRASVKIERYETQPNLLLQAAHNGYQHLKGHPILRRYWELEKHGLEVCDFVNGKGHHCIEIFFHFHPDVYLEAVESSAFAVLRKNGDTILVMHVDSRLDWRVKPGFWHPHFGVSQANICLHGSYYGPLPIHFSTKLRWQD